MRKNNSRLLAGTVVLGLFAFVGVMVVGAFGPSANASNTTQGTSEVRVEKSQWEETRGGSTTKP